MLDAEGLKNFFEQIHGMWIEPEIAKRKANGELPDGFQIFRCLVRLPQNKAPIVEFNDEIGWVVEAQTAPGTTFTEGQDVYLHNIQEIVAVQPPLVDGLRVAFVFLFCTGLTYSIIFDFSPNVPEEFGSEEQKASWEFSNDVAEHLQALLTERSVHVHDAIQEVLQQIGLWAAPALLPYPLTEIARQLQEGDTEGARNTLVAYCEPEFLQSLSHKWWDVAQFQVRKPIIEDAFFAHEHRRYSLSIHTLLPQLEGVITDYIATRLRPEELPWRQESKTKKFRDLVIENPPSTFTYRRVVESATSFILSGPVLKTFKDWIDQIDEAFPNRHVVEHGRYDALLYTEENSIKLFLLLDSIYHIISGHNLNSSTS